MKTNYSQFCMENGGRGADPHELDDAFVVAVANSSYAEQWNQPAGGFKTVFIGDRAEMLTHCRAVDLTIQTQSKALPLNPLNPQGREYTDTQRELRTDGRKKTSKRDKPKAPLRCNACDEEGHFESDCKILKRFKEFNRLISYGGSKICGFHGANTSHTTKSCKHRKRYIEDPERDWFTYQRNNRQPRQYDNGYRQLPINNRHLTNNHPPRTHKVVKVTVIINLRTILRNKDLLKDIMLLSNTVIPRNNNNQLPSIRWEVSYLRREISSARSSTTESIKTSRNSGLNIRRKTEELRGNGSTVGAEGKRG